MTQEQELFTILSSMILNKVYCRWETCPSKFKDSLFRVQGIQLLDSGGYMILLECMDDPDGRFIAYDITKIKPYLRPMSSMTNDERFEYLDFLKVEIQDGGYVTENYVVSLADMPMLIDWLNAHHFDYRGLIKMGLALEAPEGMYKEEDELPEPPETDLYRYKNEESI